MATLAAVLRADIVTATYTKLGMHANGQHNGTTKGTYHHPKVSRIGAPVEG